MDQFRDFVILTDFCISAVFAVLSVLLLVLTGSFVVCIEVATVSVWALANAVSIASLRRRSETDNQN